MARWRPLHQNITRSDKMLALAREGDYFAMNLYQNMLPYTDRAGRLNAHPLALLGSIFEGYPWTPEQIHAGLEALNRVGLITWYRTARQGYLIEYTNFEGLNILDGREAKSQLPGPTDDDCTIIPPAPTGPEQGAVESPDNPMEITWDASESPGNLSAAPGNPHEPVRSFSALHVQSTSTSTPTLTTLVENASEPPPPELVEAAPRLSLEPEPSPSNGRKPKARPRKAVGHEFNPVVVAGELPPQFDPDRFLAFCGMRLKRGWPMTLEALKAFLRKHQKHPRAVLDEMFDNAIVGQWQDLYPLKHDRPTGSARASPARDLPTAADFEHVPTNAELLGLTGGEPN